MTIDKAIKHAEEVAEEKEKEAWEAQLQEEYKTIKSCKECAKEHRQLAEWLKDYKRLKEQQSCDDCISRQAVLDMQYRIDDSATLSSRDVVNVDDIEDLPSVTPQPKMGHWIRVDKDKLRCSECEVIHLIAQYPNGKVDWCPNCGAKMQEVEDNG